MRTNDNSIDVTRWSKEKLFRELNHRANFENNNYQLPLITGLNRDDKAAIRQATKLYRETWVQPLIRELARRMKVDL